MREYFLEALREIFVEAIAAHKFIEMRYHRNQNDEIDRLKRRWKEIKIRLMRSESEVKFHDLENLKTLDFNVQCKLIKVERELESIKLKVLEQQRLNNKIIKNIEEQLAEIKLISHTEDDFSVLESSFSTLTNTDIEFEDILSELKLQMSSGVSNNSEHQYIEVVDAKLESLRKQLDEM